jgi:hypothetical protein
MEEPESKEGFKVTDRRRFTTEGESKGPAEAQETVEKPEETEAAEPQEEPGEAETTSESEAEKAGSQSMPPMDFSMFVLSMANTAMFQLGFIQDPQTGETRKDLPGARQTIDLIALLEEKTRGNLTEQEAKIVKEALFQLRMAFVEAAK